MGGLGRFSDLRKRWEDRAERNRTMCAGVLYRGLPSILNEYIHRFHSRQVDELLLTRVPHRGRLLDLGCGYGRIGKLIAASRPDIEIIGSDFSIAYCRLHRKELGAATVCADISALPFPRDSFDAIVLVTALMYAPPPLRTQTAAGILRLLKPGGLALFIEPSQEVLALVGLLRPNSAQETTGGSGFTLSEYRAIAQLEDAAPVDHAGMPVFTLALPVLFGLGRCPPLQRHLLRWIGALDEAMRRRWWFSLQRAMLVQARQTYS